MAHDIIGDASDPPLKMAAEELHRALQLVAPEAEASFRLLVRDPDPEHDRLMIDATPNGGTIAGSNPRSVLFATYRYLTQLGFRWIRPGAGGEIVPEPVSELPVLRVDETASCRFRTICIEGACSFEHVRDLIDWGTRHGLNGYFLQFDYGSTFWEKWYTHADNPDWPGKREFSADHAREIVKRVINEITRRGLFFERVGHGWTSQTIGIPGESWDPEQQEPTAEQRAMLAEIRGKREFFHGVALNTNLCYSNPEVRRRFVDSVSRYAAEHPEVDLLHIWLADGSNNHCECSQCRRQSPADWYVQLLNEIDAALTAEALPTRLVFLIYVDLLWPPEEQRLANPDRFVLMFAPITRLFNRSFADAEIPTGPLPPYKRNELDFPKDVGVNLQMLRKWQELFPGQGFDFDYHLIWAVYFDPNFITLTKVLHRDIQTLQQIGLDGLNSCQVQRLGFPHNLPLMVMACTLWNRERTFRAISRVYFRDAFGLTHGAKVEAFFTGMSDLWEPFFNPVHLPARDEKRREHGLAHIPIMYELIGEIRPCIEINREVGPPARRQSWAWLESYLEWLEVVLPAFQLYLEAKPECRQAFEGVFAWLRQHEPDLHPGLDVYMLQRVLAWRAHEVDEYLEKAAASNA